MHIAFISENPMSLQEALQLQFRAMVLTALPFLTYLAKPSNGVRQKVIKVQLGEGLESAFNTSVSVLVDNLIGRTKSLDDVILFYGLPSAKIVGNELLLSLRAVIIPAEWQDIVSKYIPLDLDRDGYVINDWTKRRIQE